MHRQLNLGFVYMFDKLVTVGREVLVAENQCV